MARNRKRKSRKQSSQRALKNGKLLPRSKAVNVTTVHKVSDVSKPMRFREKCNTSKSLSTTPSSKWTQKLVGARFRQINETLYTATTKSAAQFFAGNPGMHNIYHVGYAEQVQKWPVNPVEVIHKELLAVPKDTVVADLGCGDAYLAQNLTCTVHSFDLEPLNRYVTVSNMDKTPLANNAVDICVYCLSLMATNVNDVLAEAHRILRHGGRLIIAEVQSRFFSLNKFKKAVESLGFTCETVKHPNDFLVFLYFIKSCGIKNKKPCDLVLKPCVYKKR